MSLRRGALAAAGCLAMQIPYGISGDAADAGTLGSILTKTFPVSIEIDYDGYNDHWWWDNVAHMLGGYAVGCVLAHVFSSRERVLKAFLLITGAWECFEYVSGERPWHTAEDGTMVFAFDHAMEDTALDTVMGAAGAYAAATEIHGRDVV